MAGHRVLITGGSGFLGINLVRYLLDRDYEINVLDVVDFDYEDVKDKIKFFKGDIRDKESVRQSMLGCDLVVHTAAALPLYPPEEIISTDVEGTENVLSTALQEGVERVVHVSSTAVYGIPDHHPLFEDDEKQGVGPYGEAKVEAEEVCYRYRSKGLVVPILRPKSFVGPERLGVMAIYYDWIKRGKNIPIVGSGRNHYQLLDVEDLCEAIYMCLTKPDEMVNDTYNIGAEKFTTMAEDFGSVIEYAGTGKRIIPTPAKPLILVLRILEALKLSPLYRWVYETAPEDSFVSVEKAKEKLGFTPRYSNKQALTRNYRWYLEHYDEFSDQEGVSHRVPWKQGILKVVSWFF
ncbi:MAG: NAD-dependent epimerase/dehydratase family protein [Candidatus Altiarchaeales archaeon]|nr:NAD-dependent epimerase/dehydratase family protein [Candidatus Altiarchaeales archaeon]